MLKMIILISTPIFIGTAVADGFEIKTLRLKQNRQFADNITNAFSWMIMYEFH